MARVSARRSTWTAWNLRAETERLLRAETRFASLAEHRQAADAIVAAAISPPLSLCTDAPALLDEPPALRRPDGESVFTGHGAARYTSQAVLDAEQRLLTATRTHGAATTPAAGVTAALDGYEAVTGTRLDAGQLHLVTAFTASPRLLLAGIGPAGTGKTTAMRALAHVLGQQHRRLIPLATSATAAGVLGRELGVPAENLHKFLHEWQHGPSAARLQAGSPVPAAARPYALGPGDVVLVDEAGLAGTFPLDQLTALAAARGAAVRLLGDDRQLSAPETGGALRLIAAQPGTPQLTALHRFRDPAEATATLQLRTGDTTALDWYTARGRIQSGSRQAMTQAAYHGWKTDMLAGKTTLMAAASQTDVTALAARARADRVTAGQVEEEGILLRDGNLAGTGDWIITRRNQRRLPVCGGRDWVKNGDGWHVTTRHPDGSLTCTHLQHHGRVRLPAAYAAAHAELLYATTAHRAQGTTTQTVHPLITPAMTREMLYVLATRAREHTTLYVATHDIPPHDLDQHTDIVKHDPRSYAAREILQNILGSEGSELSATQAIRASQDQAASLATLVPRYLHAARQLAQARYRGAAALAFGDHDAQALASDPAWGALARRLYDAETSGWQPARLLADVARHRELDTADSIAEVLCWRIDAHLPGRTPPPHLHQPAPQDARRYAALLSAAGTTGLDPAGALPPPGVLTAAAPSAGSTPPDDQASALTTALGPRIAARARHEPAWPALHAVLRRAGHAGHDPAALLAAAARIRELRTARSISEVLTWHIGWHLETCPAPLPRADTAAAWQMLAWTLKAAEDNGTPAETLIPRARPIRSLHDLTQAAQAAARPYQDTRPAGLPPWLTAPPAHPATPGPATDGLPRYLNDAATLITSRTRHLADAADRDRPPWMDMLGQPHPGTARHQQWLTR